MKIDTKQLSQIVAQHQQKFLTNKAKAEATGGSTSSTGPWTGETETIIEGDLLPGINEMIIHAPAAAFPLDCLIPGSLTVSCSYFFNYVDIMHA